MLILQPTTFLIANTFNMSILAGDFIQTNFLTTEPPPILVLFCEKNLFSNPVRGSYPATPYPFNVIYPYGTYVLNF